MRALFCIFLTAIPVLAQIPQAADGKPDFSGFWETPSINDLSRADERTIPYTAAGRAAWKNVDLKNDPLFACLYPGVPRIMGTSFPIRIVQTPGLIVILFEFMNLWRTIPLDGRAHPPRLEPSFLGNSTGGWDGKTLVIDTVGLKGAPWTWLDAAGHQHTDALHVTERLTRTAGGIQFQAIIDDPAMYSVPWRGPAVLFKPLKPAAGPGGLMEFACNENNQTFQHMVSTRTMDPRWDISRPSRVLRQNAWLFGGIGLVGIVIAFGVITRVRSKGKA